MIGITDVNEPGDRAGCFPGGGAAHLFRATVFVAPVSAAPPGKMAARLTAKHKNKRPGLLTEPFVYVAMTAAFPGGGAAHLFRATGSVAPVSAAPPTGEDGGASDRKTQNKRPSLSTEPFVLFDARQFPTLTWGETPHYHRRYGVSLLSSAWGQVGPPRYRRRANSVFNTS